jgi:hypothetical protein
MASFRRAGSGHADRVPELHLGVVHGLQGDRGQADEQGPLGTLTGGQPHQRVGGPQGVGQVEHRLLLVGGAGVDQVPERDLAHVRGDLGDLGDHLVAEGHRVGGGAAGRRVDEGPQASVEHLVGEGRGAAVQAQLGPVADAAEQGPQPDLAGAQRAGRHVGQAQLAGTVQHQGARHRRRSSFRSD